MLLVYKADNRRPRLAGTLGEGQTHVQTHEISLLDCPTNTEKHKHVCVCVCLGVCVFVTAAT